jgi:high affinity sulfate transporter 1
MSDSLPDLSSRPAARWIPSIEELRGYDRKWLRSDLTAGLTGASVVVPQAMAYAAIAGLPLVTGLYTALIALVVYAITGTSRPLSVTTTSTIAILTAGALHEVQIGVGDNALLLASTTLAFLVGVTLLISAAFHLGAVANFISEPVLVGFKAGVGLTIVLDQIPRLLGLHFAKGHFFHNVFSIFDHLPEASMPTVVLAATMLALLLGLQHYFPRVPAALVTVSVGIIVSAVAGLNHHEIELVGAVKGGFPSVTLPKPGMFEHLWPAAVGIALMSFVETTAAGQAFRNADEPAPQPNRELLAIGLTNVIGSFFQNMPSGGGTSQTAVNREAGARTQIAGLVTAAVVLAVLMFLAPIVQYMPQATLAAVVIVPCAAMIHPHDFGVIFRFRAMEYSWAIASMVGVLLLGTLRGILVAVLLSLLALVYHANRRPVLVLARKPGTDVFRPLSPAHPLDEIFPGLLMIKTEGIMHFANTGRVIDRILQLINEYKPRVLVVDCSAIPDFEYTAMTRLTEADKKLQEAGITLWLAALNPEPLRTIEKSEFGRTLGRQRMYFNLEQAVESFLEQPITAKSDHAAEQN